MLNDNVRNQTARGSGFAQIIRTKSNYSLLMPRCKARIGSPVLIIALGASLTSVHAELSSSLPFRVCSVVLRLVSILIISDNEIISTSAIQAFWQPYLRHSSPTDSSQASILCNGLFLYVSHGSLPSACLVPADMASRVDRTSMPEIEKVVFPLRLSGFVPVAVSSGIHSKLTARYGDLMYLRTAYTIANESHWYRSRPLNSLWVAVRAYRSLWLTVRWGHLNVFKSNRGVA